MPRPSCKRNANAQVSAARADPATARRLAAADAAPPGGSGHCVCLRPLAAGLLLRLRLRLRAHGHRRSAALPARRSPGPPSAWASVWPWASAWPSAPRGSTSAALGLLVLQRGSLVALHEIRRNAARHARHAPREQVLALARQRLLVVEQVARQPILRIEVDAAAQRQRQCRGDDDGACETSSSRPALNSCRRLRRARSASRRACATMPALRDRSGLPHTTSSRRPGRPTSRR